MHRVELKVIARKLTNPPTVRFLMHRVELKVKRRGLGPRKEEIVPNAPCGVESFDQMVKFIHCVPFLMHRVELKVLHA